MVSFCCDKVGVVMILLMVHLGMFFLQDLEYD